MECLRNARRVNVILLLYRGKCQCLKNRIHTFIHKQNANNNSRFYSKRLPYEVDTNVRQDILLYTNKQRNGMMLSLSVAGVLSSVIFGGWFTYTLLCVRDPAPDPDETRWWKNNIFWRNKNKTALLTIIGLAGFGFTFIGHQVPAHTVKNIWLLAGGQKVRIHTYGPFLSTKEMIVPLSNMTCTVLPEPGEENKDVSFKIKGSRLFYSVECKGDFLQPKLFNSTVGMYRKNFNQ
ncbi:transmembrane protein 223-like [Mytilus galloprovincialis]|uniref:Transmembrane protein 223 n=1 Tax=Mytilus galloprovincialis TaxID=29158 RepID=A0A8B6EC98_MYTGA|nr:Hypothetical predicted protein [Mytilus galloprovincialis]